MLFNSLTYLIFLPIVLALYWLLPLGLKRGFLLFASYYFYMSWLPEYGLLLLLLSVANYWLAMAIDRNRGRSKPILILGLTVNLGTLCFYKYANFLLQSLLDGFSALAHSHIYLHGQLLDKVHLDIILPLGISFFAFEFIHYLTDVYKGGQPIRNWVDFGLFAAFFPSQIAGPIKRYQDFVAQLAKPVVFKGAMLSDGLVLILQGLFKKVAISDNLSPLVAAGFSSSAHVGTLDTWIAVLAFAMQIYLDFSGYTDMGRGSAMMLGFSLPDNFNLPYIASNLSDFWKRWHISLSSWLRDYLYIPLGGGRTTRWRKHLNLLITMLLGGLWHGAAWHYVAWGGLHGVGLVVSHEYSDAAKNNNALQNFHRTKIGAVCSMALTFFAVLVGWVLFRADTVAQAMDVLTRMFVWQPSELIVHALLISTLPVSAAVYSIYSAFVFAGRHKDGMPQLSLLANAGSYIYKSIPLRVATCAIAWMLAVGFAPTKAEPFIYFQF
jgi:alginate O-acetyltransferase complex protein AlgI